MIKGPNKFGPFLKKLSNSTAVRVKKITVKTVTLEMGKKVAKILVIKGKIKIKGLPCAS